MTRAEFIKWLKDEVTLSGSLNVNIKDEEIDRIINRELRYIYDQNPEAVEQGWLVIPREYFYQPEFRNTRQIQFPECVISVSKFVEMKRRNQMFGIADPDFTFNKAFRADMWFGQSSLMDAISYRLQTWSAWDQLKQFTLIDIHHTWNQVEHRLTVMGHDPQTHVYCELFVKTSESALFDNIWVQKWIAAHCKLQVNKLLTLFQTTLIGGVTINLSSYVDEANKDIEECKLKWKELNVIPGMWTIP